MQFLKELGLLGVGSRLRKLHELLMDEGTQIYEASGLNFEPRWFSLFQLIRSRPTLSINECAQSLGVSHVGIIKTLTALVDVGYVTKIQSSEDSRKTELSLTKKGRQAARKLDLVWASMHASYAKITRQSQVDFLDCLEKMETALLGEAFKKNAMAELKKKMKAVSPAAKCI